MQRSSAWRLCWQETPVRLRGCPKPKICPTLDPVSPGRRFQTRSTPRNFSEFFVASGKSRVSTMRCWWLMESSFQSRKTSWLLPVLTSGQEFSQPHQPRQDLIICYACWSHMGVSPDTKGTTVQCGINFILYNSENCWWQWCQGISFIKPKLTMFQLENTAKIMPGSPWINPIYEPNLVNNSQLILPEFWTPLHRCNKKTPQKFLPKPPTILAVL